ncbi:hypothetical protein RB653_000226 [Dictyostelium firmibasis]|uniref:Uncharacterized protein n=1 Tax=Dictyostelium firmibasis TaxID=79012 RepID=A0AAN7U1Y5_9MYCE
MVFLPFRSLVQLILCNNLLYQIYTCSHLFEGLFDNHSLVFLIQDETSLNYRCQIERLVGCFYPELDYRCFCEWTAVSKHSCLLNNKWRFNVIFHVNSFDGFGYLKEILETIINNPVKDKIILCFFVHSNLAIC